MQKDVENTSWVWVIKSWANFLSRSDWILSPLFELRKMNWGSAYRQSAGRFQELGGSPCGEPGNWWLDPLAHPLPVNSISTWVQCLYRETRWVNLETIQVTASWDWGIGCFNRESNNVLHHESWWLNLELFNLNSLRVRFKPHGGTPRQSSLNLGANKKSQHHDDSWNH